MLTVTDCIVIGGGVIGLLTARELAQNGLRVTLLERGETGHEASWAGGGILSPLYPWRYADAINRLTKLSQALHRSLAEELRQETGIDPEWTQSGCLMLNVAEQTEALAWAATHGITLQPLEQSETCALEPALRADPGKALGMPHVAQTRNPRLLKALKTSLLSRGVTIREHTPVQRLLIRANRIQGVVTESEEIGVAQVVLAAGAWSATLLKSLGYTPGVIPVRGQMILFRGPAGLVQRIVMEDSHYLIPRRDGHILVGSTVEYAGFDKSTTQAARDELYGAALALIPALINYQIEHHWAGLRPGSPGGIPFIGAHPESSGLYVNTGHYRNGLTLGPASARLLADLMLGRTPPLDPTPYSLETKREEPSNPNL
jgi:glycine oxidase